MVASWACDVTDNASFVWGWGWPYKASPISIHRPDIDIAVSVVYSTF